MYQNIFKNGKTLNLIGVNQHELVDVDSKYSKGKTVSI